MRNIDSGSGIKPQVAARRFTGFRLRAVRVRAAALICLLAATAFAAGACGAGAGASAGASADAKIVISGLPDGDVTASVGDIAGLKNERESAEAQRSNGTTVKIDAVGPTLDTFLAQYGVSQTDYASIRFTATDGYAVAIPREILENRDVILAYKDGDKALGADAAPLQIVVPGERAMYWARMVSKIELSEEGSPTLADKVIFLDSALPGLKGKFSEDEGGDIVPAKDLTDRFGGGAADANVTIIASDGLTKNESAENFLKGYIKYTGEKIPQFCSPQLPLGMNIDGVLSIRTGDVLYYSLDRAAETLPQRNSAGKTGIGFMDIVKENKFGSAASYTLTNLSGEQLELSEEQLVTGVFTKDGDSWNFWSSEGNLTKDVLSVGAN